MALSRIFSAFPLAWPARWAGVALASALGLLAQPATAQISTTTSTVSSGKFFGHVSERAIFSVGWQVGRYAGHGMGNMYYHALRLNRSDQLASLEKAMAWTETYGGPALCLTYVQRRLVFDLRWSNRRTVRSARWTDLSGQAWSTDYRVRLNELSLGLGYPLWGGRLRPGISGDFGLFRVSRRDAKGDGKGKWTTMHSGGDGLLAPGERSPTAGLTLYCDVAPLGSRGAGLTLRPFYQTHLIQADLFGLSGTLDTRSFNYSPNNYGLAVSWGFTSKN